jgi:hypothetical protein
MWVGLYWPLLGLRSLLLGIYLFHQCELPHYIEIKYKWPFSLIIRVHVDWQRTAVAAGAAATSAAAPCLLTTTKREP